MTKTNCIGRLAAMTAALAASLLLVLTDLPVTPARAQTSTPEATLVGAGDIASCSHNRDRATARVLADVQGTVFTLGDNVYPDGTTAEFRECYHPTWGTEKARTKPSVGNHEYHTRDASGYFGYFGARAGDPARGYYGYQRGSWRVVVLNSNCSEVADAAETRLKAGGSSGYSPTTRRSARLPTSTIRCSLPPGPPPPR